MDPFSAEGELVNLHTAFTQAQYTAVLNDYSASDFSESNRLPVKILQLRAQCALGQYDEVKSSISASDAKSIPDLAAVKALAIYESSSGAKGLQEAQALAEAHAGNLSVQLLCGTVLAKAGQAEDALKLLSQHQGSLDAVALIVQIYLSQNRTDLALKEAKGARSFAQDALLVNLAESWVGMRQGGDDYQKAFYVFEELAQAPSSSSATSLVAQAVSELHLGRLEEAATALQQALTLEPENSEALANQVVLCTILGQSKDAQDVQAKLGEHELLQELSRKRDAFAAASAKYNPKFEP